MSRNSLSNCNRSSLTVTANAGPGSALSNNTRSRRGRRTRRNAADRCFNDTGTATPFAVNVRIPAHTFKVVQTDVFSAAMVTSLAGEVNQVYAFEANQLSNFGNFASLFDQYRVDLLEVWISPRVSAILGGVDNPGILISAIDQTDPGTATILQLQEYESALISHGTNGHYRRYKPHVNVSAYAGGFGEFVNESSPWIDTIFPNVEHYGLKYSITQTSSVYNIDLIVRAHLTFRQVR